MIPTAYSPTNAASQTWSAWQAGLDSALAGLSFVAQPFQPTVTNANMVVYIAAGIIPTLAGTTSVAAQTVTLSAANATNPRIDRVVLDRITMAASVVTGTAAATPAAPSVPAGKLPCLQMLVPANATAILNTNGTDERALWLAGAKAAALMGLGIGIKDDGTGNLTLDVTGLTAAGSVDATNDMVAFWSNAAGALRKASISQLGGVTSADFLALQQEVAQNYLLDAVNGAWAAGSYSNGGYDAYSTDTIGSTSTSQTYDGTNKLYTNTSGTTTASSSGMWSWYSTTWTAGTGTIAVNTSACGYAFASSSAVLTGDFDFYSTVASSVVGSQTDTYELGVSTAALGNGNYSLSVANNNAMGSWYVYFQGVGASRTLTFVNNNTVLGSVTQTVNLNDVFMFRRRGSALTVLLNGTTIYTFSGFSSTAALYVCGGDNGSSNLTGFSWSGMGWKTGIVGPNNMTLLSSALSPAPASTPTQVKLMVLWKDLSGSAVLNTDFTAEATRDGATWTAGTLSDTGLTISGFKVLWAMVDVSAQPSGTTVKYRMKTLNTKSQQAKGIALMVK